MNKYIQDKLLEKHICRFNDGECNCDCYIAGMTDYHNHIVENLERMKIPTEEMIHDLRGKCDFERNNTINDILSLLQDTNPKE